MEYPDIELSRVERIAVATIFKYSSRIVFRIPKDSDTFNLEVIVEGSRDRLVRRIREELQPTDNFQLENLIGLVALLDHAGVSVLLTE